MKYCYDSCSAVGNHKPVITFKGKQCDGTLLSDTNKTLSQ